MNLIESIMTRNPCYKQGKTITVKGIILHSVGCPQPNAKVFIETYNKESYSRACVHAFIDANTGYVYKTLPWKMRGWHCGGTANSTHIGVEMCEPDCIKYTSGTSFTCSDKQRATKQVKATYQSAVKLFAKLCKKYNLNPLKDGVILSHSEASARGLASNHADPEHLWRGLGLSYTMDGFRNDVNKKLKSLTSSTTSSTSSTTSSKTYYTVQSGDTLSSISRETGVSISNLVKYNNILNVNMIIVGQRLSLVPVSSTPQYSVTQVAKDVIKGKYGNGDARKKAIESLGLNYDDVQKEVNRLLK